MADLSNPGPSALSRRRLIALSMTSLLFGPQSGIDNLIGKPTTNAIERFVYVRIKRPRFGNITNLLDL